MRIARLLPEDGHLYSLEVNPLFAAISTKVVELAGLSHKCTILVGPASKNIPLLAAKHPGGLEMMFLDHVKHAYEADLKLTESSGLLGTPPPFRPLSPLPLPLHAQCVYAPFFMCVCVCVCVRAGQRTAHTSSPTTSFTRELRITSSTSATRRSLRPHTTSPTWSTAPPSLTASKSVCTTKPPLESDTGVMPKQSW